MRPGVHDNLQRSHSQLICYTKTKNINKIQNTKMSNLGDLGDWSYFLSPPPWILLSVWLMHAACLSWFKSNRQPARCTMCTTNRCATWRIASMRSDTSSLSSFHQARSCQTDQSQQIEPLLHSRRSKCFSFFVPSANSNGWPWLTESPLCSAH